MEVTRFHPRLVSPEEWVVAGWMKTPQGHACLAAFGVALIRKPTLAVDYIYRLARHPGLEKELKCLILLLNYYFKIKIKNRALQSTAR